MEGKERQLFTRRKFILSSASLAAGLFSLGLGHLDAQGERLGIIPSLKEGYQSQTPEGYKIAIIGGRHGEIEEKQMTPIKREDLYSPVGAIFIDNSADYLDPRTQRFLPLFFAGTAATEGAFFQEPIKHALENNIPLIFGDITLRGFSAEEFNERGSPSSRLIFIFSILASANLPLEKALNEKISRRKFFQILRAISTLGAFHFSTKATIRIMNNLGIRPETETGRDFQAILADIAHPEDFVIVMRNIVWALKCRDFYKKGEIPEDKVINVIGGADHRFFDFFVRHPEIAKKYWHLFGYGEVAAKFSGDDPSWVYKSYLYDPVTKEGRIIIHDDLKDLVV